MKNILIMVPLVSFLAALRILTEAQICNNGEGKIVYEKLTSSPANAFDPDLTGAANGSSYELVSIYVYQLFRAHIYCCCCCFRSI